LPRLCRTNNEQAYVGCPAAMPGRLDPARGSPGGLMGASVQLISSVLARHEARGCTRQINDAFQSKWSDRMLLREFLTLTPDTPSLSVAPVKWASMEQYCSGPLILRTLKNAK